MRILLEPVYLRLKTLLAEALHSMETGETVRLLRFVHSGRMEYRLEIEPGISKMTISHSDERFIDRLSSDAEYGFAAADSEWYDFAATCMPDETSSAVIKPAFTENHAASGFDSDSRSRSDTFTGRLVEGKPSYTSVLIPRPRLVIFGAGTDSEPVCELAQSIGFRVVVADWREPLCDIQRFPGAELVAGEPELIVRRLTISADDYVLICSHQLNRDRAMLKAVTPLQPHYIGVLGSSSRIRLLFDGIPKTSNVRAPVGVDIGSEGAEEIAVSIAAELIAVRVQRCAAIR